MLGALAMSLSSVCVVLNALRLKLFNPNKVNRKILHRENISASQLDKSSISTDGIPETTDTINSESVMAECEVANGNTQCKINKPLSCKSVKSTQTDENSNAIIEESKDMGITIEVVIDGMSCGHCSARVEKALNAIDGVSARVDLDNKTAYIENGNTVKDEEIIRAVKDAGYEVVGIKR